MLLKKYSDFGGGIKNNLIQSSKILTLVLSEKKIRNEKKPRSLPCKLNGRSLNMDLILISILGGHRGRDRMVVGFTTTCAISGYHCWSCEFEPRSWRGVLDTILCDKVVSDMR